MEQLTLDSLFKDVQRMDKRQVSVEKKLNKTRFTTVIHKYCLLTISPVAFVSISKFWHDCIIRINDMERTDGSNWQ